jgi:hypothetical protein
MAPPPIAQALKKEVPKALKQAANAIRKEEAKATPPTSPRGAQHKSSPKLNRTVSTAFPVVETASKPVPPTKPRNTCPPGLAALIKSAQEDNNRRLKEYATGAGEPEKVPKRLQESVEDVYCRAVKLQAQISQSLREAGEEAAHKTPLPESEIDTEDESSPTTESASHDTNPEGVSPIERGDRPIPTGAEETFQEGTTAPSTGTSPRLDDFDRILTNSWSEMTVMLEEMSIPDPSETRIFCSRTRSYILLHSVLTLTPNRTLYSPGGPPFARAWLRAGERFKDIYNDNIVHEEYYANTYNKVNAYTANRVMAATWKKWAAELAKHEPAIYLLMLYAFMPVILLNENDGSTRFFVVMRRTHRIQDLCGVIEKSTNGVGIMRTISHDGEPGSLTPGMNPHVVYHLMENIVANWITDLLYPYRPLSVHIAPTKAWFVNVTMIEHAEVWPCFIGFDHYGASLDHEGYDGENDFYRVPTPTVEPPESPPV